MQVKKLSKIGVSLLVGVGLIFQPAYKSVANDSYKLNNSVNAYISSDYARLKKDSRLVYKAGDYYVYKKHNGMFNITKVAGEPGGWIDPADNKSSEIESAKPVSKAPSKPAEEVKKTVGTINPIDEMFSVKIKTFGHVSADDAKSGNNKVTLIFPGDYYIYKTYNGMINVTKVKGTPGSWINPNTKEVVKPSIPVTTSKEKKKPEEAKASVDKALATSSPKVYSLSRFKYLGVINWGSYKYTYYSQRVLPGYGLRIPGRHVNSDGFVADKEGYIVLANDAPMGSVFPTPFGYLGKVYDRGVTGNWLDVYVD